MRRPPYMDRLSPEDKKAIRHYYGIVLTVYCSLILIAAASMNLRAGDRQTNRFRAVAGEQARWTECAERDRKLLTSIEQHGEAQDVPADDLAAAFLTLVKARAACPAGNSGAALAIYDSIAIAPTRSAQK